MTKTEIKELAYGYSSGYSHGKWEKENYNKKDYQSNWQATYKENLRKMISGCKSDYSMVACYWRGYIRGFIDAATSKPNK